MRPIWLPGVLSMDGSWDKTLEKLYRIFENDFIIGRPLFGELPVWWNNRKVDGQYEEGFWHLITKTEHSIMDRVPDFDRAKRLPWCAPAIINHNDPLVKCWGFVEDNGIIRTYIWLEGWDYVVILEKRRMRIGEVAFLITAYFVEGSKTRKKLLAKYENRINTD